LKSRNEVHVAILATPATIRAGAYLKAISQAYGLKPLPADLKVFTQERWFKVKGQTVESVNAQTILSLSKNQKLIISQIGPANWVDMIEHGATQGLKTSAIERDLILLAPKNSWDIVGEFCTHFPAVDDLIKKESEKLNLSSKQTTYIKQGPLMAEIYRKMMVARLKPSKSENRPKEVRAKIFISGKNSLETADLAREIFPDDPAPLIEQKSF
jgi:glutamate racemase